MGDSGVSNNKAVRQFCVVVSKDDGYTWNSLRAAGVTWMSVEQAQDVHQACSLRARKYDLLARYRVLPCTVPADTMWPYPFDQGDDRAGYREESEV